MVWALIDPDNNINDVVATEEECFEVHETFRWVQTDTADPVNLPVVDPGFTYDPETGLSTNQAILDMLTPEGQQIKFEMRRKEAYGDLGAQLGMLFDDIKAGTLETGSWVQFIETVKSDVPKP
jgi:hypothetical protein